LQFSGRSFRKFTEAIRLMPLAFNWAFGVPFIQMTRGALTSWYGYPTRYDKTYSPLRPYEYSSPRMLEGLRSLFNPFYSGVDFRAGYFKSFASMLTSPVSTTAWPLRYVMDPVSERLKKSETSPIKETGKAIGYVSDVFKPETTLKTRVEHFLPHYVEQTGIREKLMGPMVKREYGGRAMLDGLIRTHEDHAWMYKNINVIWNVNTNPGVSYLDFYYNIHQDPRLATHLVSGSPYRSFFAQDEYLQKQANLGIVRRESSMYELAEIREQELRSYSSPQVNRMWGFLNPALFLVNNPAASLSYMGVKNFAKSIPERWVGWKERAFERQKLRKQDIQNYLHGMQVGSAAGAPTASLSLEPGEAARAETFMERRVRKIWERAAPLSPKMQFATCGKCGYSHMPRDGACPVCSGKFLLGLKARKKWASFRGAG
jgi:hypothetical protein